MSDYKSLYEAKCAEAEKMRGACRRAYFALMDWDGPIQDTAILNLLREMYETCSLSEAGKPLLDKMVALEQENTELRKQHERDQREIEDRKREHRINCEIIAGLHADITDAREELRSITTATANAFDSVTGVVIGDGNSVTMDFKCPST